MDFTTQPIGSNLDITVAWITDIHHKAFSNLTYAARYPVFMAHLLASGVTTIFNSGDTNDTGGGTVGQCTDMRDAIQAMGTYHVARGNHDGALSNADLGMPAQNYYSVNFGTKWKLITMYSQENGNYNFGATQRAWLAVELADARANSKFVCIMSHVPVTAQGGVSYFIFDSNQVTSTAFANAVNDTMNDMMEVIDLLAQYTDVVKCWISGHEHTQDTMEMIGIKFFNGGAVAGNWWSSSDSNKVGTHFRPNYNMLQFNKDGTINHSYLYY